MKRTLFILWVAALWVSGCSPSSARPLEFTPSATRAGTLVAFLGPTPTVTPSPTSAATLTPLPTATPTPRTHVVRRNQDLWGISLLYGVTLDDLIRANPDINPRAMSVGAELSIPAPLYTPTIDPDNPPLPTPVNLGLDVPNCHIGAGGGVWCFSSARSQQEFSIEGLTAVIRLYDQKSGEIQSQTAYPPLNLLPPGGSLPLAAYFPPPAAQIFEASIELVSALPVPPEGNRYLALTIEDAQKKINLDGLSAEVVGELALSDLQATAALVSVAAVAYDQTGQVVGIRLWESENPLAAGQVLEFRLFVYSAGAPIARVAVMAEAIP